MRNPTQALLAAIATTFFTPYVAAQRGDNSATEATPETKLYLILGTIALFSVWLTYNLCRKKCCDSNNTPPQTPRNNYGTLQDQTEARQGGTTSRAELLLPGNSTRSNPPV